MTWLWNFLSLYYFFCFDFNRFGEWFREVSQKISSVLDVSVNRCKSVIRFRTRIVPTMTIFGLTKNVTKKLIEKVVL